LFVLTLVAELVHFSDVPNLHQNDGPP